MQKIDAVPMFWWREVPNFGDAMNPLLVKRLFGINTQWAPPQEARLLGAGSILQIASNAQSHLSVQQHVWGSGYIHKLGLPLTNERVHFHAVRGPYTAAHGYVAASVPLGDPGLLTPLLFDKPIPKRRKVGVVPHWTHQKAAALQNCTDATIINVRDEPLSVIRKIAECEVVLASSLHGLIIADAFGIPNRWVHFNSAKHFGGYFKFRDYYGSIERPAPRPVIMNQSTQWLELVEKTIEQYVPIDVKPVQDRLLKAFPRNEFK